MSQTIIRVHVGDVTWKPTSSGEKLYCGGVGGGKVNGTPTISELRWELGRSRIAAGMLAGEGAAWPRSSKSCG